MPAPAEHKGPLPILARSGAAWGPQGTLLGSTLKPRCSPVHFLVDRKAVLARDPALRKVSTGGGGGRGGLWQQLGSPLSGVSWRGGSPSESLSTREAIHAGREERRAPGVSLSSRGTSGKPPYFPASVSPSAEGVHSSGVGPQGCVRTAASREGPQPVPAPGHQGFWVQPPVWANCCAES